MVRVVFMMCVYVVKLFITGHFVLQWVAGGETQKSTAVKVDTPNQFAPQGSNPKEFQQKQKSVSEKFSLLGVGLSRIVMWLCHKVLLTSCR